MGYPDHKELKKLAKVCRESGIQSLKFDGIEIIINPVFSPQKNYKGDPAPDPSIENKVTDEDVLFWSSAGIPDGTEQ